MQLAASGNLEAFGGVCILYAETDVGVQLPVKTVAEMAGSDILSFLPCQGTVVYHEVHGDRRLGDLLERNRFRIISGAQSVADMDIGNT